MSGKTLARMAAIEDEIERISKLVDSLLLAQATPVIDENAPPLKLTLPNRSKPDADGRTRARKPT